MADSGLDIRAAHEPVANLEAEQSVIGALLYTNSLAEDLVDLKGEHFYEPAHQAVYDEALSLIRRGLHAEPITLGARLSELEALKTLGGARYLAELVDKSYQHAARAHADLIINTARLRLLIETADSLRTRALTGADSFDLIAEAERTFGHMVQDAAPAATNLIDAYASAQTTLDEFDHEAEHGREKGVMTGLRCFDRRLRGLRPGWLVVVAGRPSMGKTALARAAAFGAARRTKGQVVYFALEMARRELDERSLSQLSHEDGDGIPYMDMGGKLTPYDRQRLRSLAVNVPRNLIIDDSPILSVDYVRRRVIAMKRRGPVSAIFIDYLQIMERPEARGRNEASVIGEMTKGLKQLARETETCVVLLSQINRGVESRDDKRPQLSDLRESGAIEQDANAVLFPYRESYYLQRAEPKDHNKREAWENEVAICLRKMDVIAAKVRQGAVGSDEQVYYAEYDVIEDRTEDRLP